MKEIINFIDQLRAEKGQTEESIEGRYYKFGFKINLEIIGKGIELTVRSPIEVSGRYKEEAFNKALEKYNKDNFPERVKLLVETLGEQIKIKSISINRGGNTISSESISICIGDHKKVFTPDDIKKIIEYIKNVAESNKACVMIYQNTARYLDSITYLPNDKDTYGRLRIRESDGYYTEISIIIDRT